MTKDTLTLEDILAFDPCDHLSAKRAYTEPVTPENYTEYITKFTQYSKERYTYESSYCWLILKVLTGREDLLREYYEANRRAEHKFNVNILYGITTQTTKMAMDLWKKALD